MVGSKEARNKALQFGKDFPKVQMRELSKGDGAMGNEGSYVEFQLINNGERQ